MKLSQILKKLQTAEKTLIPSDREEEYLEGYLTSPGDVDAYYMGIKFKDLHAVTDDLDELEAIVGVAFLTYNDKWSKLYDTLSLEYNPLWNVDGVTTEERDIAKRHTEDDFAEREDVNTYGLTTGNTTYGQLDDSTENKTTPYDSVNYRNLSKQERQVLEHTDDYQTDEHEDTLKKGAHKDSHDEDAYKDTITTTRTGNIGVTSSQKLLTEEREVADFNFLDILMCDIIDMITDPYFEED